jgi:hypothetical protein
VLARKTGEELHDQDFVREGETLVIFIEHVVEFFGEGLRIVKELDGGEVGRDLVGLFVLFLS